ncbi:MULTISPECIES: ABC transporter permease [Anaerotruncus]|jgi:peptide/nickel transport system permease protein|uniref:ABC transporter permease n=1 Tax=Anaerotruncus TaxID=244127 RepID=UPI00083518E5|nr:MULTISPECIES: ABC transporter permease [Anaerotruncus]RGX56707.1 ABC transporter permease [Anaerotruncus sp. AF02-27]
MYRYVIKRLLLLIPILLCVSFVVFFILDLTPGDPARLILGEDASEETVAELREEMGLNDPFLVRYVNYVVDALHGDFGQSYRTNQDVVTEIMARFPTSIKLSVFGVLLTVVFGIPIGILAAVKQYSAMDMVSTITAMFMAAIPGFWLGLILILIFSLHLNWLPPNGADSLKNFILPSITIALPFIASIMRMTRSTMLETIRQDYIRTARSKGAEEKVVIWKHALRNALLPIITMLGTNLSILLGGTMIVETVFSMPGLGTLIVTSIRSKDIPQIMAAILFLSIMSCVIMLIVDLVYAYVDPRIKARYER